jgi:hypothetical protein
MLKPFHADGKSAAQACGHKKPRENAGRERRNSKMDARGKRRRRGSDDRKTGIKKMTVSSSTN